MKQKLGILFFLLFYYPLLANTPPEVNNVRAQQREDDSYLVDIYYDVTDADGDSLIISLEVSEDDGSTWVLSCELIEGDIGSGISSGNDKHIIWNVLSEHPDMEDDDFRFKVTADDGYIPDMPIEWCTVPAGEYTWGPLDVIDTLDYDYQIMKHEVTNAQYVNYLEEALDAGDIWVAEEQVWGHYDGDSNFPAGEYVLCYLGTPTGYNYAQINWVDSSFVITVPVGFSTGDFNDHPVVYVTWFGAWAFAEHHGFELPTEEEWEKAARGMTGNEYPWGNTLTEDRANYRDSNDPWDNGTTPIGYYNGDNGTTNSPSPYGCYDMCGNVTEWTDSWHTGNTRIIRGGDWSVSSILDELRSWHRNDSAIPTNTYYDFGFRCVIPSDENDFEWCLVTEGYYTWGEDAEVQILGYDYEIMKYQVTNSQYLNYLEEAYESYDIWIEEGDVFGYYEGDDNFTAGNYRFYDLNAPSSWNHAWITWEDDSFILNAPPGFSTSDFEDHPVVEVTWFGASAFAEHYGLRLPTEREWEKATRGETGYDYPWGNTISGDRANYYNSGDPWDNGTTPAGYYNGQLGTTDSPSPYGCYDMCGNVWEWTNNIYNSSASIVCGGSWSYDSWSDYLLSWTRNGYDVSTSNNIIGFRCAKDDCGPVTDIDGNVYETVQIGDQCWMAENLKVTHYRNGDPIPHLPDSLDWEATNDGAYCIYENIPSNENTFGKLYNWYAVNDPRGLAPEGWHVATDEDIMELEMYLGMSESTANEWAWRGTNEGSKLAGSADLWNDGNLELNPDFDDSEFSLKPGGYRRDEAYDSFEVMNVYGDFWSSSEYSGNSSIYRGVYYNYTQVYRYTYPKNGGMSVRCVKD